MVQPLEREPNAQLDQARRVGSREYPFNAISEMACWIQLPSSCGTRVHARNPEIEFLRNWTPDLDWTAAAESISGGLPRSFRFKRASAESKLSTCRPTLVIRNFRLLYR